LLFAGITARPLPKLGLLGNLRFEDRPDKTPIARYNVPGGTQSGNNEPRSIRSLSGKAEASYSLPLGFRITSGFDYDQRNRNYSPVRVVSAREDTEEKSWRVELRRSMSDTITGALSYIHSDRDGSPFLTTRTDAGTFGANLIAPLHLSDREREKLRFSLNWNPFDRRSAWVPVPVKRRTFRSTPRMPSRRRGTPARGIRTTIAVRTRQPARHSL
jgi:Putative outer membrane beta-barrel porin, MtrB/PioB